MESSHACNKGLQILDEPSFNLSACFLCHGAALFHSCASPVKQREYLENWPKDFYSASANI